MALDQATLEAMRRQHPAWRLLNRVATQALGYDDEADPRLQALLTSLDPWVAALAAERAPNSTRLAEALAALEALCLAHLRSEQKSLGASIERLRRAEREAEASAPYRARIEADLATPAAQAQLTPLLREVFLGAWHLKSDDFDAGSGVGYFNTTHGQLAFSFSKKRLQKFVYYFDPSVKGWQNPTLWVTP